MTQYYFPTPPHDKPYHDDRGITIKQKLINEMMLDWFAEELKRLKEGTHPVDILSKAPQTLQVIKEIADKIIPE